MCTENLIRVDDVMESPKLADDRAVLFLSGGPSLAIQVEVACVYRKPYPGLLSEESAKLVR